MMDWRLARGVQLLSLLSGFGNQHPATQHRTKQACYNRINHQPLGEVDGSDCYTEQLLPEFDWRSVANSCELL